MSRRGVPVLAGVGAQVACGLFLMTALQAALLTAVTHISTLQSENTRRHTEKETTEGEFGHTVIF